MPNLFYYYHCRSLLNNIYIYTILIFSIYIYILHKLNLSKRVVGLPHLRSLCLIIMSKFVAFLLSGLFLTTYAEVDIKVWNATCLLHDDTEFKSAVHKNPRQIPGKLNCHEMIYVPTAWPNSFPYMMSLWKTVETKCETHLDSLLVKTQNKIGHEFAVSPSFFMTVYSSSPTNLAFRLPQSHDCNCYVSRRILAPLPIRLQKHNGLRHKALALSWLLISGLLTLTSYEVGDFVELILLYI
jgi:hypothetical protein